MPIRYLSDCPIRNLHACLPGWTSSTCNRGAGICDSAMDGDHPRTNRGKNCDDKPDR